MELKNKKQIAIILTLISGVLFGVIAGIFLAITHDLPQIQSLETFVPSAVTRIYSTDKELLAELYLEKRDPVPLKSIPHYLKTAIITTEDKNFYKHSGVDLKGILRAIIKDILARKFVEGASTITQQLAKTLFLTSEKSIMRKIKEAFLAFQLEHRYTKDKILELYLNQIYLGSGAYGVESAAQTFFGKPAKDLNLAECALIAAMPKAPSRYSPLVNKDLAVKRRNIVLKQMANSSMITEAAYNESIKEIIIFGEQNKKPVKAPYFVEYVKEILEETLGSSRLYKGGLIVYTTLSFELQKAAEDAVENGLYALEIRMRKQEIMDPLPQSALIALNIQSGGILAMVGGRDFDKSPFNRATNAKRQPGSAFKPVVYATAIERGFPQNRMILDAPVVFKGGENGKDWQPENFSKEYKGEITLRTALTHSANIPAIKLTEMLGPSSVARFGHDLGIESTFSLNLSLALGTSETTLIDLTSAYAVFPNMGKNIKPFGIIKVLDREGKIIRQAKPEQKMAMSQTGAAIITDMLCGVIREGTGKKANVLKRPVAGKTGTTNNYRDALFIGFSPSIAAGVWVGQDNFTTLGKHETGAKAALPIWIEFMKKTLENNRCQYFDIPDDVVQVRMNPLTGQIAPDNSQHAVSALFKRGTEPKKK